MIIVTETAVQTFMFAILHTYVIIPLLPCSIMVELQSTAKSRFS